MDFLLNGEKDVGEITTKKFSKLQAAIPMQAHSSKTESSSSFWATSEPGVRSSEPAWLSGEKHKEDEGATKSWGRRRRSSFGGTAQESPPVTPAQPPAAGRAVRTRSAAPRAPGRGRIFHFVYLPGRVTELRGRCWRPRPGAAMAAARGAARGLAAAGLIDGRPAQ
ncbi:uncharacterized protein LOC116562014 [Sapajus apella]|uniref:Uncharacterized protein LOC116562014 n=1 Tax=Sapajus apella TaxID=9515 RepID=A0A6J3J5Y6_SAPAP|nr:uncharacterized protein LOC116562014 [Sapajus apella]